MLVDWRAIERAWLRAVVDAIVQTAASNPTERFYAGAFWLLHGDYSSLLPPAFGLNSENAAPGVRWHPPDWRWPVIDAAVHPVQPLYRPLESLEIDGATYEGLWDQHIDMLARVSREVTKLGRATRLDVDRAALSPGFFVGIIDFSQGDAGLDYLRRSVDEETIAASGILVAHS